MSKHKLSAFLNDEKGGLPSLEMVLLSIPMIIMSFCVAQFMLLAHANIVIKSAAHAAARSAMVNKCVPLDLTSAAGNLLGAAADTLFGSCEERPDEWDAAARMALLPIAPSNGASEARQSGCAFPESLILFLHQDAIRNGLEPSVRNKACYVFEPGNVAVEVDWDTLIGGVTLLGGPPPMTARVQFKVPLLAPTREIFNSGKREDDTYFWQGEAEVTLL